MNYAKQFTHSDAKGAREVCLWFVKRVVIDQENRLTWRSMLAEVKNLRLYFQQGLLDVVGSRGPMAYDIERIRKFGCPNLGGNLTSFFVELKLTRPM